MIFDLLENIPGWLKLTGLPILIILLLLGIFYINGDEEAISLPKTIKEAKKNVTTEVTKETTNAGVEIVKTFSDTGKELSKDIRDPSTKYTIQFGWTFAGIMLALALGIAILGPLFKAFK